MSEELDAIDDELLAAIARIKGHAVQKGVPQPVSVIYPLTAKEMARLKAEEKFMENVVPGKKMPDGTVYVGRYSPTDRDGNSLRQAFNVFAAKEDLSGGPSKYSDTVRHLAGLKGWNGYNGAGYANDTEFYDALRSGTYKGEWIIPTIDILQGSDVDKKATTPDNIFARSDDGAFRNTFNKTKTGGVYGHVVDCPVRYWSCTVARRDTAEINDVHFYNGDRMSHSKDNKDSSFLFSCRPVRLVPCK
jgi:hypothetical protein